MVNAVQGNFAYKVTMILYHCFQLPIPAAKKAPLEQQQQLIQNNEKHYVTRYGRISKPPSRYNS